jgi:hypothetical protein
MSWRICCHWKGLLIKWEYREDPKSHRQRELIIFLWFTKGKNVKVKLQNLSSQSVLINESNRLNSEDSTQCYNSKLATDSAQPIRTKYDLVSGNAMFSQNNQYNKRKLLIFHQNIQGLRSKTNEILCHFSSESPHFLFYWTSSVSIWNSNCAYWYLHPWSLLL